MSKGTLLRALVLLQACVVVLYLPLLFASSSWRTGRPIGGDVLLCQDPIRRSCLMLSRGPEDEFNGADSDSIFDDELADDRVFVSGDEYASDDGGGEAAYAEEEHLFSRADDDDSGAKHSSGEFGSGGDVECPECGKFFKNDKSMFGHLRSHPNRGYKGATPPHKKLKLSPDSDDAGSPALSLLPDINGDTDSHATQHAPPPPPSSSSFREGKLDVVEQNNEVGIEGLVTDNVVAEVKTEDPDTEVDNALLCDEYNSSIVKIPKKRRRGISKEDRDANRKVKLVTTTKEKRPYMCKHCKAEFSTHQALGGHMAGHHREKKTPAPNNKETSLEHQGTIIRSQNGKQANGGDEPRGGLSLSSRRMQVEQLSMASNMSWLSGQAPGGHVRLHFVRRNNGAPPTAVTPATANGDRRRRPLNIDLNVEAPGQD